MPATPVDIGVIITENGEVLQLIGLSIGNKIAEGGISIAISPYGGPFMESAGSITVTPDGTRYITEYIRGTFVQGVIPWQMEASTTIHPPDQSPYLISVGFPEKTAAEISGGLFRHCFVAGTLIGAKAIEEVAVNDEVLSYDADGNLVPGRVTATLDKIIQYLFGIRRFRRHLQPEVPRSDCRCILPSYQSGSGVLAR